MLDINKLIADAMKSHDRERLETLKLIKSEIVKVEKSGETIDDAKELKILLKMIDQRNESIKQYKNAGRQDLADEEQREINVISQFIPAQPSDEEIAACTKNRIKEFVAMNDSDWKLSMRDMKAVLTKVQETYPMANGKIVSKVLKEYIGQ